MSRRDFVTLTGRPIPQSYSRQQDASLIAPTRPVFIRAIFLSLKFIFRLHIKYGNEINPSFLNIVGDSLLRDKTALRVQFQSQ